MIEKFIHTFMHSSLPLFGLALLCACQPTSNISTQTLDPASSFSSQTNSGVSDLIIVDCLLPGQIRRLGNAVYQSPRRPKRLTARECGILGGEYVIYDQANYQTALKAWKIKAKSNDVEAQTYVGEMYEKGLGTAPDYAVAALWYRKAAEQGYARAQINLGHLFELGLGVPKDMDEAIRWYRKGAGLTENIAIKGFVPSSSGTATIQKLQDEIERLQRELQEARKKQLESSTRQGDTEHLQQEVISLKAQLDDLKTESTRGVRVKAKLPKIPSMDKGKNFALIIGNNIYSDKNNFPELKTAINDSKRIKSILINKYRFSEQTVEIIPNAKHEEIFETLAMFKEKLGVNDNFLIYFAGHGFYDELNSRGHWLPVDARRDNRAKWISNEQITDYLNEMLARHILVIADSCYSGTMTDFAILQPQPGMPEEELRYMVKTMVEKTSRTVLTSGSLTPVFDTGGGKHSVFAEALFQILEDNNDILAGKELYNEVFPRVSSKSQQLFGKKQEPDYGALHRAGHLAGDFLFVPQTSLAAAVLSHHHLLDLAKQEELLRLKRLTRKHIKQIHSPPL